MTVKKPTRSVTNKTILDKVADAHREATSARKRIEDLHSRFGKIESLLGDVADAVPGLAALDAKVDRLAGKVAGSTELGRKLIASKVTVVWIVVATVVAAEAVRAIVGNIF